MEVCLLSHIPYTIDIEEARNAKTAPKRPVFKTKKQRIAQPKVFKNNDYYFSNIRDIADETFIFDGLNLLKFLISGKDCS